MAVTFHSPPKQSPSDPSLFPGSGQLGDDNPTPQGLGGSPLGKALRSLYQGNHRRLSLQSSEGELYWVREWNPYTGIAAIQSADGDVFSQFMGDEESRRFHPVWVAV